MDGSDGNFTTCGGYKALPAIPVVQEVANELGPGYAFVLAHNLCVATHRFCEVRIYVRSAMVERRALLGRGLQRQLRKHLDGNRRW
jgi:hypothetical protein